MKVLIVDDESLGRVVVKRAVANMGHEVTEASDGEEAWELFQKDPADVIVSDWRMPGLDGLELCRLVRGFAKETYTYFILLTVACRDSTLKEAMEAGVDDFLSKPLDPHELLARFLVASRVSSLHRKARLARERISILEEQTRGRTSFQEMIGKSSPMQEIYRRIRLAAQSQVSVLLHGETGTGKELAARAIHSLGARASKPFITVNCGAIPESLLESELFGHVKGSFTGAIKDKSGLFQLAHGGTLLLDEIGDISPLLQVKLLRALQEQEIRRVGDEKPVQVDVRIIAATNKDLKDLVSDGEFREDLYYRVRVFEIHVPPLRERREDIPLLVDHYLKLFSKQHGKDVEGIDPEAFTILMNHSWPGNVRELRNAIEHAFVTVTENHMTADDLPLEFGARSRPLEENGSYNQTVDKSIKVLQALRDSNGNRTRAAKMLGISRVALWKRIRRLGLESQVPPPQGAASGDK